MRNSIFDNKLLDTDERTDGQGFVLVGESTTNTPPVTEKISGGENQPYKTSYENPNMQDNGVYKKKTSHNALIIILALILGLGGGFGGGALAINYLGGNTSTPGNNFTINTNEKDLSVTEAVAKKVLPSVVGITATTTTVTQDWFYGTQEQEVSGVGSGIILDTSGYILTNSHVIMDNKGTSLKVLLSDGREVSGTVEWFDAGLDLAIAKITADNLTPAELGDSDSINVGQYVAAIGNPLGLQFQGSVTQGVVSGLNRTIVASSGTNQTTMENLIQVDAAINSGNSGGPLLNSEGHVIGINTAKAESGENMGFAIPINQTKPIIESIKETGEYSRAYMGVSVTNVAEILQQNPTIDLGTKTGAYVVQITQGSPAEAAGLQERDVIVEVDGTAIKSRNDLINLLLKYSSGDEISVQFYRDGQVKTAKVTLINMTQE